MHVFSSLLYTKCQRDQTNSYAMLRAMLRVDRTLACQQT